MTRPSADSVAETNPDSPPGPGVSDRLSNFIRLDERPEPVRWALLLLPYLSWWWLDGWLARVGFSRRVFDAAINLETWSVSWLGALPLLALGVRVLLDRGDRRGPEHTVGRSSLWVAVMVALRLCALSDPVIHWFPWLSIMWAPHLAWGMGLAILWSPPTDSATPDSASTKKRSAYRPLVIGLFAAVLYSGYTFYFCQLTMLHGDEGQYLRVTQSLLRDGDIDLSNNLGDDHVFEFHVTQTGIDQAPASPEGKVHSIHPVGLSALLMPVYQIGVALGNPRLFCALFMALLSALCIGLLDEWLHRLGISPLAAGTATFICATSAPLFFFSNQLYPEIPALLISLIVLVQLPVTANPRLWHCDRTIAQPAIRLTGLALLLVALPFLHPRYLPLGGLLGVAILWEAWRSTDRHRTLAAILTTWLAGLGGLVAFNIMYSGDWLGAARPGNAWDENALQPATWLISLPGQWLHATKGLFTNAPVFALAGLGLSWLALRRDPRLLLVAGLYAATAMINGLHPVWWFGFCLPARFLVTAIPAIALSLAVTLERSRQRVPLIILLSLACVVGWELIAAGLSTPEMFFEGRHLALSSIQRFYPLLLHGVAETEQILPLADTAFWVVVAGCTIALLHWQKPAVRVGLLVFLLLWPGVWGRAIDVAPRMKSEWVPGLNLISDDKEVRDAINRTTLGALGQMEVGTETGTMRHAAGEAPGLLAQYYKHDRTGLLSVTTDCTSVQNGSRNRFILRRRNTLSVVQPWEERVFIPISADASGNFRYYYLSERSSLVYLEVTYAGGGDEFRVGTTSTEFRVPAVDHSTSLLESLDVPELGVGQLLASHKVIQRGRYRVRFALKGSSWSEWFVRRPTPIHMAIFVTDPAEDIEATRQRVVALDGISGAPEDPDRRYEHGDSPGRSTGRTVVDVTPPCLFAIRAGIPRLTTLQSVVCLPV